MKFNYNQVVTENKLQLFFYIKISICIYISKTV